MAVVNYRDVVEILKISQDRPARNERFEAFRRAVSFYTDSSDVVLPSNGAGVYLIAGTNGKGTVAKTLEQSLIKLLEGVPGASVGLFTSPHLIEPTERIRSQGHDLSPDEMARAYDLIHPTVQKFALSHFEILTLMMIEVFFGGRIRPRVSHAVIEVGVGGRLDPTRVIPHETAVLARIGRDHEALLGSELAQIAREKLAIAEGAKRLIYMKPEASLDAVFRDARAAYAPCEFIEARVFPSEVRAEDAASNMAGVSATPLDPPNWRLKTPWGEAPLSLMGERAVQNTSLALEVLHHTGADVRRALPALARVQWPGRMERRRYLGHDVYLSGDHNEQGVQSLAELLAHFRYIRLWLVVGVGQGKPLDAMLRLYQAIPGAHVILTRTSFRSIDIAEFERYRDRVDACVPAALDALKLACERATVNDLIVVSGSLYLVGDLRAAILLDERANICG